MFKLDRIPQALDVEFSLFVCEVSSWVCCQESLSWQQHVWELRSFCCQEFL